MHTRKIFVSVLIASCIGCTSNVLAANLTVNSTANIFASGHSTVPAPGGGSGGTLPPVSEFSALSGQIFKITSLSGNISLTPGSSSNGNGTTTFGNTDITSFGGISGIVNTGRAGFLVGVFLGETEPSDPAPSRLTFAAPDNFTSLSPVLGQTFLIGNGLDDTTGTTQQFFVPTSATRLFLGFADAFGYHGAPGQYQDNSGSLSVNFEIAAVPEPSVAAQLCAGLIFVLFLLYRKNKLLFSVGKRRVEA